jgi:hypothetical protein
MKAENLKYPFLLSAIVTIFGEFLDFLIFFGGGILANWLSKNREFVTEYFFLNFFGTMVEISPKNQCSQSTVPIFF